MLNLNTGEIRFQYETLPNGGAGSATIGVENANGSSGVQVSYNDASGASSSMGYKFTPAPPQPSKTYTVSVDSTMQSVGFLLTGYSGDFDPLLVTTPSGSAIQCTDSGVLCLDLDLVQYIQVDVKGRTGVWSAVVAAGPSGQGTFSFTSFAASPLSVSSSFDHSLATRAHNLLVRLTQPVDGSRLTGRMLSTAGAAFGASFNFFDDGAHGDGRAGDGLFGSESFDPPGAGSAFLRLNGEVGGESFERIDSTPYTFAPVELTSLGDMTNDGGPTILSFQLTNYDTVNHCYWVSSDGPEGWRLSFPFFALVCANAGESKPVAFTAYLSAENSNDLPSGTTGIMTVSVSEWEKGEISDSASARITRVRPPAVVSIFNPTFYLRPNGDQTTLEVFVVDDQNVAVGDGTTLTLEASSGVISPTYGTTVGGMLYATFTSGPTAGSAVITATTANSISATTTIEIGDPKPSQIALATSADRLPAGGSGQATLTAAVTDRWGDPVAGQEVRLGIEGDGQYGLINGAEVVTGTTDANGQFSAVFTSGASGGVIGVRAELYVERDGSKVAVQNARRELTLEYKQYLPFVQR